MYADKTTASASLDLSLYIEGLLNIPEEELKTEVIVVEKTRDAIVDAELLEASEEVYEEIHEEELIMEKIPVWGQKPFKSLLVKLAGMDLMVPAMTVSFIEKINRKITRLPLEVEAFKGVITLREKSIAVIDLLGLISESVKPGDAVSFQVEEHHINHVLVMEEAGYALACDDVSQMISMEPDGVRWNNATFNNPMFAGVVADYLCPILDIDSLDKAVSVMPFVQTLNKRND